MNKIAIPKNKTLNNTNPILPLKEEQKIMDYIQETKYKILDNTIPTELIKETMKPMTKLL